MLNTVLFNLIGNALKFTPKGNPVTIRAREDAGWLTLEVRDAGVGMEQDTLGGGAAPLP
jgi:signal transduction histidine kinase